MVLAVQGGNLPGILTRNRRVETLEDLAGLRLRAPAELLPVLRHFGADPVEMPMGEVYSALAKGVLDGVVAPKDTLKSLHFAEVAHYFNTLSIPRGAYAARAMGERRWRTLSDDAARHPRAKAWRSGSTRSNRELRAAEIAGDAAGQRTRRGLHRAVAGRRGALPRRLRPCSPSAAPQRCSASASMD